MTKTRLPAEFKLFRDRLVLDLLLVVVLAAVAAAQPPRNQLCRSPSPQMIQESQQFLHNTPCAPVTTACAKGGYLLGCSGIKKVWTGNAWRLFSSVKLCRRSKCFQRIQTSPLANSSAALILEKAKGLVQRLKRDNA